MSTLSQNGVNSNNTYNINNNNFSSTSSLANNPHLNGVVTSLTIMTPNNPNSALRNIANVKLYNNNSSLIGRVPGVGYLPNNYNSVLVEGGSANDLPTVRYTLISGVFDFASLYSNNNSSSVYGTPSPEGYTNHVRSCFSSITYV